MTEFFVPGIPVPQGSGRAIINRNTGKAVMIQSRRTALHSWRDDIRTAAIAAGVEYIEKGPVWVHAEFILPRPKNVPKDRCGRPTTAPDLDKLLRSCFDALSGVAYRDDAQVSDAGVSKHYAAAGEQSGVRVVTEKAASA